MQRIEIIHGVVLGNGKHGRAGEIHEVEDHIARVLFHAHQARVASAPTSPPVPIAPAKLQKMAKAVPEEKASE